MFFKNRSPRKKKITQTNNTTKTDDRSYDRNKEAFKVGSSIAKLITSSWNSQEKPGKVYLFNRRVHHGGIGSLLGLSNLLKKSQPIPTGILSGLGETKENIIKATAEARKDIPRYTEVVNDYQEQTIEATKEIINNYLESQKEIINSFQSAWAPYLENVHQLNQYWINPLSPMTAVQAYIRMVSNFADNMIWGTRLANNIIFANMNAFKR